MNIIFKMLKYLKNYSHLITGVIIVALIVVLVAQSLFQTSQLNNLKSSYKEEVSVLQTELDSLRTKNEELETKVSEQEETLANNEKVLLDKDAKIRELEETIGGLKDTISDLQETNKALVAAKANSLKADGNYSQATTVWNSLKAAGLNDHVCAGILGNIMAEVGGQTLDISRWPKYSQNTYYGICQWAGGRKQRLLNDFGTTLEDQISFLTVELFEVIPKGNSFYNMQDEKEAALYFAKYYERCGSGSYSVRQSNATKALNYFTN